MTTAEKIEMTMTLLGTDDSALEDKLEIYLNAAGREILAWRYSYSGKAPDEVPEEYEMTQIHAVIAGYSQSGAEGQKSHSENGISRTFAYADMMHYIRANVMPLAGVM